MVPFTDGAANRWLEVGCVLALRDFSANMEICATISKLLHKQNVPSKPSHRPRADGAHLLVRVSAPGRQILVGASLPSLRDL